MIESIDSYAHVLTNICWYGKFSHKNISLLIKLAEKITFQTDRQPFQNIESVLKTICNIKCYMHIYNKKREKDNFIPKYRIVIFDE